MRKGKGGGEWYRSDAQRTTTRIGDQTPSTFFEVCREILNLIAAIQTYLQLRNQPSSDKQRR